MGEAAPTIGLLGWVLVGIVCMVGAGALGYVALKFGLRGVRWKRKPN